MPEWGDLRTLIGLAIILAALAGYYTGKYQGYIEGQRAVLAYIAQQQDRVEETALKVAEVQRAHHERAHRVPRATSGQEAAHVPVAE